MLRRITAPAVVALAVVAALLGTRLQRVEVVGESMAPTVRHGERLLALRSWRVRPGDLVVVRDPRDWGRLVVKRVTMLAPRGVSVVGDNPAASTDSRVYGPVRWRHLIGRVVYRYAPPDRAGSLRQAPTNHVRPGGPQDWVRK